MNANIPGPKQTAALRDCPEPIKTELIEAAQRMRTYFPPPIDYDRIRADTEGGKRLLRAILGKEREGE